MTNNMSKPVNKNSKDYHEYCSYDCKHHRSVSMILTRKLKI